MFLETSAKTAYNVVEAFNLSASCILNNVEKEPNINGNNNSNMKLKSGMETATGNEKKGCC